VQLPFHSRDAPNLSSSRSWRQIGWSSSAKIFLWTAARAFFFHLPGKQYLMLLLVHRRPKEEGGNPDFQEIRVVGYRGTKTEVAAESPLERKLIELLRAASINTNDAPRYSEPPKPERLLWIVQRMQDRKSKW
jgi:hypothetical protein